MVPLYFVILGIVFQNNETGEINFANLDKIDLGIVPIMVRSELCLEWFRSSEINWGSGEIYEQGGYFIIKGAEKGYYISKEKRIDNILYVNKLQMSHPYASGYKICK